MNEACNSKKIFGPAPWGPGEGSKGQISFDFNYKVNFKDFLYQTLCLLCCLGHAPGIGLRGAGVPRGSKYFFFSNMVMWHIKSTGMTRGTECK